MLSNVAKVLKADRLKANLTQEQLAEKLGINMLIVNQLENSKRKMSAVIAVKLEQHLERTAKQWMDLQVDEDIIWARKELEADQFAKEQLDGTEKLTNGN